MKVLRLPSSRAFLFNLKKQVLQLLPFQCQDFAINDKYFACYYYKSVQIYRKQDIEELGEQQQVAPVVREDFTKKIEAIDIYTGRDQLCYCIVSDKFGDINRINIDGANPQKQTNSLYLNSNLGIPKYIKHRHHEDSQYLILGDEQKRIKVYNSINPHELVSVWHILNMHSVGMEFFGQKIVLLLKYFDQVTLQEQIEIHQFSSKQIESEEYPGRKIQINLKFDKNSCLYYSMGKIREDKIVLVMLTKNSIFYELIQNSIQGFKSLGKIGQIQIEQGAWEYIDILDISTQETEQILVSYGKQVQLQAQINQKIIQLPAPHTKLSLNPYEKIIRISL